MVAEVGVSTPRFPPGLLENLKLLAEDRFRQKRGQRVVIRKAHHVHARGTGRGCPPARLLVAVVPSAPVAELAQRSELPDVVDQRTGIADREAATAVERRERIPRPALVGIAAVVESENVGQVVLGMLPGDPSIRLPRLEYDRVPRVLHPAVFAAVAIPFRPVGRLVVMPEPRNKYRVASHCRSGQTKRREKNPSSDKR